MGKGLNSRNKGNRFEREVAKILSDAWGFKFVRTPNSGAFKGLAPADIIPEDKAQWDSCCFHIECKARKGWSLEQLISSKKKCPVLEWWFDEEAKQVEARGAKFYDKAMLLIFTKNHDDTYVMFSLGDSANYNPDVPLNSVIVIRNTFVPIPWYKTVNGSFINFVYKHTNDRVYYFRIMTLKDFLANVKYEDLKFQYETWLMDKQLQQIKVIENLKKLEETGHGYGHLEDLVEETDDEDKIDFGEMH